MKKIPRYLNVTFFCALVVSLAALGCLEIVQAAPKKIEEREAVAPAPTERSAERAVPAPSDCGGMEFNREAGRMVPRPNIDLVVKHLEIFTTERGTWVRPTIRNNCPQVISDDIHVSIGRVVVTYAGLPPQTDAPLGYAVGVPAADTYTVIVDYDRRITESNDGNNRCTRSTTGNCP
jgi:hypothetical protein